MKWSEVKCKSLSHVWLFATQAEILEWAAFPFSRRIFPTQGLNPGLPHCRRILYQLSHNKSLRILEWVAYPFSSRSSRLRNRTGVSCIAGGFFTNWASGKPLTSRMISWNASITDVHNMYFKMPLFICLSQ